MNLLLSDPFLIKVAEKISGKIESSFQIKLSVRECFQDLSMVPNLKMGHLCFPCFKLAKQLKSNPGKTASTLAENWTQTDFSKRIQAIGPYLNFFFKADFFGKQVLEKMIDGDYFKIPCLDHLPFLVEYSQPNTHKELHVGHMRNLCFGHSLILLLEYCGHPVVSCTFPGDVGTHVAKCLWYLKHHNREPVPKTNKGEWLGKLYTKAHNKLEDEKESPVDETNRKQLTEILKQIEQKQGEFFELWKETRQWSIELMEDVYNWAGVSFDKWYWESDVDSDSVKLVKELLNKGKLIESQGAVGLNLEDENLGFYLFLKSDGNGLYSTKDLELARRKFQDFNPCESIVVVDMRQELHFKQVFTAFGKLGLGDSQKLRHLKYNFVELPDGAMSSRKGNIVPINQLIKNMKDSIKKNHLEQYKNKWSAGDIDMTANQVAQGAIKYGMNKMDPNKKIIFDMKEWLRLDGDSGPYIQYTHARICSLLEKLKTGDYDQSQWGLLKHQREEELMVHLSLFNWFLFKSLESYKTSGLCRYLYDLAKIFNGFYHDCPIGSLDDKQLKEARLALVQAVGTAIAKGLGLLGIPAPKRM